jgi:hypothetical protein
MLQVLTVSGDRLTTDLRSAQVDQVHLVKRCAARGNVYNNGSWLSDS